MYLKYQRCARYLYEWRHGPVWNQLFQWLLSRVGRWFRQWIGGFNGFRTRHGWVYTAILAFSSASHLAFSASILSRISGDMPLNCCCNRSSRLCLSSASFFSHWLLNSSMLAVNDCCPGGLTNTTGGYRPICMRTAPIGITLGSRIGLCCKSFGQPRCACQLYEWRNTTSFSATSLACQYPDMSGMAGVGAPRAVPASSAGVPAIDGCTDTPSSSPSIILNDCTSHLASASTLARLKAARLASASGTNSMITFWPANGRRGSAVVFPRVIQLGMILGELQIAKFSNLDWASWACCSAATALSRACANRFSASCTCSLTNARSCSDESASWRAPRATVRAAEPALVAFVDSATAIEDCCTAEPACDAALLAFASASPDFENASSERSPREPTSLPDSWLVTTTHNSSPASAPMRTKVENLATASFLCSNGPNHFQKLSPRHHSVKSAMYSPKQAIATNAVQVYSAYSHQSIAVVSEVISDAVKFILRHKGRQLVWNVKYSIAVITVGSTRLVRRVPDRRRFWR